MMCDPKEREQSRARGDDPDKLPAIYARVTNAALEGRPADMAITMHSCRGNFRSTWIAQGGYEFVAEHLLGKTSLDGYFLEYDSDRAGGFEPLRHFPKGKKQLVLGLVTSKSGRLEPKDDIKRRIDEAAKYVPLDQLCLSPQCGFASTEEGNVLAEEEQWAKLRMIVELANEVWGKS
jgi:5-methyltetrahydropteroyltriglutamate--homocysteine methyltransferase